MYTTCARFYIRPPVARESPFFLKKSDLLRFWFGFFFFFSLFHPSPCSSLSHPFFFLKGAFVFFFWRNFIFQRFKNVDRLPSNKECTQYITASWQPYNHTLSRRTLTRENVLQLKNLPLKLLFLWRGFSKKKGQM